MLAVTMIIFLMLVLNYAFAQRLYAYSFEPAFHAGTFNVRGSDAAEWLVFPEDRVGSALSILLMGSFIAFVLQLKNDRASRTSGPRLSGNAREGSDSARL